MICECLLAISVAPALACGGIAAMGGLKVRPVGVKPRLTQEARKNT